MFGISIPSTRTKGLTGTTTSGGEVDYSVQQEGNMPSETLTITPRERQVLELLADGLHNKDIGSKLQISANTVKHHVASMTRRLCLRGMCSRVALAKAFFFGCVEEANGVVQKSTPAVTQRMRLVGEHLTKGYDNFEIGQELGMGERTVKAHLKAWYRYHNITEGCRRVRLVGILQSNETSSRGIPNLTERQRRVATLAVQGLTNKVIGKQLGTSENMTKNYLKEIYDETGVFSRTELAARYGTALLASSQTSEGSRDTFAQTT
jgi:DNA-binding NarL/FixJ family response regulator